ncbi:MAG: phospholipase D-like domain-containing protein [Gammaproteobacteria bacterium]|nr:phospholipase D-like domain-containing protein [Gammaproteobacteria bacterium]
MTHNLLASPWGAAFENLVTQVSSELAICSPYIGRGPCERIASILQKKNKTNISITLLTDLSIDNALGGFTDIEALTHLYEAIPGTKIQCLPNVHAKIYIADECSAVVTSSNLTDAGMYRNFEYGLCIKERRLVKKIAEDFRRYATLGAPINPLKFPKLKKAIAELREIKAQLDTQLEEKSVKLSKTFESKRQAVHEQLLVARAEGMSPHAAFADTILYLLKQAPTSTEELYPAIQNIHPELCDDTVKLVIKGKEWGQPKWRHQIRHLQQSLKKQGRIKLGKEGKWHLA